MQAEHFVVLVQVKQLVMAEEQGAHVLLVGVLR
jgi:hypothetical protein